MTNRIPELQFSIFPKLGKCYQIEGEFFILDSADQDEDLDELINTEAVRSLIEPSHPLILDLTICTICRKGSLTFLLNAEEHTLHANELVFGKQGDIFQFLALSPDIEVVVIGIKSEKMRFATPVEKVQLVYNYLSTNKIVRLQEKYVRQSNAVLDIIKQHILIDRSRESMEAIWHYLMAMLCGLVIYIKSLPASESRHEFKSRGERIYFDFLNLLHEHHREQRDLKFYADKLCITPKHLSQVVLNVSGKRPGKIISEYILLEAKALLSSKQYSVQEVSYMLNFANQSFFGTWFRRQTGLSPRRYMENEG